MGSLFGGGSSAADDLSDQMAQQQADADAQTEAKRKELERQRMKIIKSEGGPEFYNPDDPAQSGGTGQPPPS